MLDPITTPLLILVLGKIGEELLTAACKDYLKDKLKSLFGWLGNLGRQGDLERAYQAAMQDAYTVCLEMLLANIKACGLTNEELKPYAESLRMFIKDHGAADELLEAIKNPLDPKLPRPEILAERWQELGCHELPGDLWTGVALAFRRQARKQAFVNEPLREILNAQTLDAVRMLLERDGGVRPEVRQDKYTVRMRTKYSPVDLANLMPAYAENPGRLVIRDVFVPQMVKENPPAVELPKDFEKRLREKGIRDLDELSDGEQRELGDEQRERLSSVYVSQSPKPVLEVIADPNNRLVMLVGEPGSGKSTLMRYLLLGVLEPPLDAINRQPLLWTTRFRHPSAFPLLVELRDFHATRVTNDDVDSFLDYALYMGRTEQYFLDDQWLDQRLHGGPSLVLFDGLDEIFERADREKVMQEIVGFSQRYPQARIVVTSRPVGYRDAILRPAGFRHFALQDLDEQQIETFTRGWFTLTFPQQPELASQRIERVLSSIRRSRPILLLAGNPMLLTIMALLAREQELPRERAAFYEAAVNVLCHHWDANRNLTLPGTDYLRLDDKKELLRRVAMRMQTGKGGLKGNAIHEIDLEEEVAAWFSERFKQSDFEVIRSARLMIHQLRERNYILCLRGPRLYGFVHRTFLEFLTAAEYVNRFNIAKTMNIDELFVLFDSHCRDEDWPEVLRLIAGQINEQFVGQIVERLVTRADLGKWTGNTPLPELPLAIYCLSEVRNPSRLERAGQTVVTAVCMSMKLISADERFKKSLVDFLTATTELGARCPINFDYQETTAAISLQRDGASWGQVFWPRFVGAFTESREIVLEFITSQRWTYRWGCIETLAEKWPDESTRELLRSCAAEDLDANPRRVAMQSLAEKWPDESTRELLRIGAVEDRDVNIRGDALLALADNWPDDFTRELLRARAVEDKEKSIRSAALQLLAENWPDESAQELLRVRAVEDKNQSVRSAALKWLAEKWPDESTWKMLRARAVEDPHQSVQRAALQLLVAKWPDVSTRELLRTRAVEDSHQSIRNAAVRSLASKWPDESTRELLRARAVEDPHQSVRGVVLQSLAVKWPDESTRESLRARAVEDPHQTVRRVALQLLAEKWPDESTRALLRSRSVESHDANVRGMAGCVFGGMHSQFGRIVGTRDLNGMGPYLDPLQPLSSEQIQKAAAKADIAAEDLESEIASLNQHLGWDIRVGARSTAAATPAAKPLSKKHRRGTK